MATQTSTRKRGAATNAQTATSEARACWKCGTPPLTPEARKAIREAARREIEGLMDRDIRDPDSTIDRTVPLSDDQQVAELLLRGDDVDAIMEKTLKFPLEILPSLMRLTHLE